MQGKFCYNSVASKKCFNVFEVVIFFIAFINIPPPPDFTVWIYHKVVFSLKGLSASSWTHKFTPAGQLQEEKAVLANLPGASYQINHVYPK